jgi:hypothetical protein
VRDFVAFGALFKAGHPDSAFAGAGRVRYVMPMSTVQEIEAAADLLPDDKKEELLRFLAVRLRKQRALPQPRIYSAEEVASMVAEDEADGERFRQGH